MEALQLFNTEHSEVTFISRNNTLVLKLKGIVAKNHLRSLRHNINGIINSLNVNNLILNTLESEYQEFDFTDEERKNFYKEAEVGGLRKFKIVYPYKYFIKEIQNQWKVFFGEHNINIDVVASRS